MKTIAKFMLLALLVIGLTACAVCQPGNYATNKIITVDLQLDPEPVVANEPQVINIKEKVLFDFDSYTLDAEADSIVSKVSKLMAEYPDTLLALKGHTDKYGAEDYNQTLSENRAEAVQASLINAGVATERITSVAGFGKTQLIPNLTNRENRRVLILSIGE